MRFLRFAVVFVACAPATGSAPATTGSAAGQAASPVQAQSNESGYKVAIAGFDYAKAYALAAAWLKAEPTSVDAALAVANAANAQADLAKSDEETEVWVGRSLAALAPFRAKTDAASQSAHAGEVQYFVAEALALSARTKGTAAIAIIPEVAVAGEIALKLSPDFMEGAPQRLMGMVLSKAPPWPHGPGDPDRGLKMLQDAAEKFPRRSEGYAHVAEVMLDHSRVQDATRALQKAKELMGASPRAKKLYAEVSERMKTNKKIKKYD